MRCNFSLTSIMQIVCMSKPIRIASTCECESVSLEKEKRIGVVHAINIMPTAQPTDILMAI